MNNKERNTFWVVYFVIAFLAVIWPLYTIGNRIYPLVLGMPFSMFWIVLWIVITFIGLLIKHYQESGDD